MERKNGLTKCHSLDYNADMDFIELLKTKQGTLSTRDFARLLSISESLLLYIYRGDRRVSRRLALRIKELYPDLLFALAQYILSEDEDHDGQKYIIHG